MSEALPLSSPRWHELRQAYGTADNIPDLLAKLQHAPPQKDYKSEPWSSIWSSLCHQDDVYTATYAAVPHIVQMARQRPPREQFDFILFVGYVELCRHDGNADEIPDYLAEAYAHAICEANQLTASLMGMPWDKEEDFVALLSALAAFQQHFRLARTMLNLEMLCPECAKAVAEG